MGGLGPLQSLVGRGGSRTVRATVAAVRPGAFRAAWGGDATRTVRATTAKFEKRHYFPKITTSDSKANLAKKSILAINMHILAINMHILNINKHILDILKHILAI